MSEQQETEAEPRRRGPWLDALVLLALVVFGAWVRLDTAARDGILDRAPEQGLLKSDPGLLYYLTERVATADGLLPDDWNADPRIAHPGTVDVPGDYTVGLEFLFGWTWRAFGQGSSLLRWCHVGSALLAALTALGVWGLARELCGSRSAALLAALLYLLLPASYRTIGFVLIREDLSLPLFALHLWLGARALRLETRASVLWAAVAACLALATWHAMTFVLAIEATAIFAVFLRRGSSPLVQHLAVVIVPLALTPWLVPAVGGGGFFAIFLPLVSVGLVHRLQPARPRATGLGLLGVLALPLGFLRAGPDGDFSHVYEVLLAKMRHGGVLPSDPSTLSFDARLLWQGPFATLEPGTALAILGIALLLALPALVAGLGSRSALPFGLALFALVSLVASWLVFRLSVLPAILLPPLILFAYSRGAAWLKAATPASSSEEDPRQLAELAHKLLPLAGIAALLWQAQSFHAWRTSYRLSWYRPEHHVTEIAEMVAAVKRLVPAGAAVTTDFMNSTALLAWTDHPVVLQPKWERASARRRVEDFWRALYGGTPGDLRSFLMGELRCRHLVIDREMLWTLNASRYCAGLPLDQARPSPGTAAAALLAADPAETEVELPGYELLWSSPRSTGDPPGPTFRLYALDAGPP